MRDLEPGDPRSVGDYRLLSRLGAGGMGQVFLGMSPGGRRVAVKVVHRELVQQSEFHSRFRREVLANRLVSGAYTAPVVVSDLGPFPPATVLALAAALAEALTSIHDAGLVHRDLKPSNVLLAEDGPRVIDFGIARINEASSITRTGMMIGSPGFMSPEQVNSAEITPASDVFSLGTVLAYAATGINPFGEGPAHAMGYRAVYTEPDLEAVSRPDLRSLIADCLAKTPEERPAPKDILVRAGFDPGLTTLLDNEAWLPAAKRVRSFDQAIADADTVTRNTPESVDAPATTTRPAKPGPEPRRGPTRRAALLSAVGLVVAAGVPAGIYLTREQGPDPIGAWPLDERSKEADSIGSNDGKAYRVRWGEGNGGAPLFDGRSDIVIPDRVVSTGPGKEFSVSAWVYLSRTLGSFATAVSQSAGDTSNFYLRYSPAAGRWAFADRDGGATSRDHPEISTWTHLVGVRKGGELHLYVNGVEQRSHKAATPAVGTPADKLFIGRARGADGRAADWFPGSIKDVQVFNKALSPDQIKVLAKPNGD
ncbi:protein kinase [Streptomyces bathyalis]|uniref:Protein kinase n=1 Tax=Streptomyces bathyalis TaxID=2710756 RepID=A0A7T1T7K6_9ACTN|nr:LamG-like jellyroll fold domain-containing protein [Streptomyces bathyalis]QPP07859.1 protein kinase [Streptomyces bathyalis]